MLRLHLLRHAKTEQFSSSGKDFDRPLMKKGRKQRDDLVRFFEHLEGIEKSYCSSAKRTRETIEPLLHSHLPKPIYRDDLYLCSHKTMLELIWGNSQGDLLIVGHNFGISDLANYFTEEDLELRTGQYIRIVFDAESWMETSRGTGIIEESYRPEV